jgi:phosphoglycerate dehydrogenase-like enzyme
MKKKVLLMSVIPVMESSFIASTPAEFEASYIPSQASDNEKITALKGVEILFGFQPFISESVLKASPDLKFIQLMSAGYDSLDLDLLKKYNIKLATAAGKNASAVAEHAVALMLAVSRRVPQAVATVKQGKWRFSNAATDGYAYRDVSHKKVGLIGFGHIAQLVAQYLSGFKCDVQVYNKSEVLNAKELGVKQVAFDELIQTSDIVSLHVPITPDTKYLIGRKELKSMRPTAILINTARGEVINEADLIEALKTDEIFGAGLDVTTIEPPGADNPLLSLDNVIITPHVGGGSVDTQSEVLSSCWQNTKDFLEGKEPKDMVI